MGPLGWSGPIEIPLNPPLSKGDFLLPREGQFRKIFLKTPPFVKGRLGGIFEKSKRINPNL
jgi:hypothetical protein